MAQAYDGPQHKLPAFWGAIGDDQIDYAPADKAMTYIDFARTVRHLATIGETITVYGPQGVRAFHVSQPAGVLKPVIPQVGA